MDLSLSGFLKEILEEELFRNEKFLSEDDLKELLSDEIADDFCRTEIVGYPTRPLFKTIGLMMDKWIQTKECPVLNLPHYDLLDENNYIEDRTCKFKEITLLLEGLETLWSDITPEERKFTLRKILRVYFQIKLARNSVSLNDFIKILGKRGLLDLLGVRKTAGSKDIFPPPRKVLEETFQELNNQGSILTVGARALSKHFHRDETEAWWGKCKGKETEKNENAMKVLKKILDGATWINIHWLPHDVIICEVRQENGYGARWTHDGKSFRGFLEPQMAGGHEVGWKH